MPNHTSLASLFGDIADAIRAKTGSSAQIVADNFPASITAISSLRVVTASKDLTSTTRNLVFNNLPGEPLLFYCYYPGNISGTSARVSSVFYDGNRCRGFSNSTSSSGKIQHSTSYYSYTYSDGTLTVKSSNPYFTDDTYHLVMIY